MKNGLIAAGVLVALLACARGDQQPPATTATGWESTQAGSSVPQPETAAAPAPAPASEAKRVSVQEAQQKLASGAAVLVDVRDAQSYSFQHAQGALSIPLAEVAARAGELPKDKQIITYCT